IKIGREEGRKEGRKEGIEIGRTEGLEKGRMEGRIEGRTEGESNAKLKIAKTMKARGMSDDEITEITGLSREDIAGI
ncbi:MAG: hypothetical protein K2O58_05100, partial [Bacteroidales bacterium]|nr:hypothetical protein [Bacteroidales bacterium]